MDPILETSTEERRKEIGKGENLHQAEPDITWCLCCKETVWYMPVRCCSSQIFNLALFGFELCNRLDFHLVCVSVFHVYACDKEPRRVNLYQKLFSRVSNSLCLSSICSLLSSTAG